MLTTSFGVLPILSLTEYLPITDINVKNGSFVLIFTTIQNMLKVSILLLVCMAIMQTNVFSLKIPKAACAPAATAANAMVEGLYKCTIGSMIPNKKFSSALKYSKKLGKKPPSKGDLSKKIVGAMMGKLGCSKQDIINGKNA